MGADRDSRYKTRQWQALRRAILDRDGHRCQIAGPTCTGLATQVDHIVSPLEGGSFWDPANLRAACARENASLGSKLGHRLRKQRRYTPSRDW